MSENLEKLVNAIETQDKNTVKAIIATGIDLNQEVNTMQSRPLHYIGSDDTDTEIATLLLEAGADPSLRNYDKRTPLGYCGPIHAKLLKSYLYKDASKETKLGIQLIEAGKDLDIITSLIAQGADINTVDHEGRTALSRMANTFEWHLEYDTNGNITNRKAIADEQAIAILKVLLEKGADPNITNTSKYAPLHYACKIAHLCFKQTKLLIKYGANINAVTERRNTALAFAAEKGHLPSVKFLIEHGASTQNCLKYAKGNTVNSFLKEHGAT